MKRLVISADWHIGHRSRYPAHTEDLRKAAYGIVEAAINQKADYFIIAGDGTDRPTRLGRADLFFLRDIFSRLKDARITVYYVLGNHDSHKAGMNETNELPVVTVFDTLVNFIDVNNYLTKGLIPIAVGAELLLVPYLIRGDKLPHPSKPFGMKRLAILHQTTGGVKYTGFVDHARDLAENSEEWIFLASDLDVFKADAIVSGHIHTTRPAREGKHEVLYTGSTCISNFGEADSGNSYFVVGFDGEFHIERVKIPQRRWLISRGLPAKITPGAVYKLVLSKQEVQNYHEMRDVFREVDASGCLSH